MSRTMGKRNVSWKCACRFLAVVAAGLAVSSAAAVGAEVLWRSGPAQITPVDRADLEAAVTDPIARHVVVQFAGPVDATQRSRLQQAGVDLLRPLGNGAYFASLAGGGMDAVAVQNVAPVIGLQTIDPAWKLDPRILACQVPLWAVLDDEPTGWRTVAVYVLFHQDVPLFADALDAVQRHGGTVRDHLQAVNGLVVELPEANLQTFADEDAVQWIEWPLPRMSVVNDSNRVITEADVAQAPPYNLDGAGITVLVYDGGTARATHVDFQGRCTVHDASGMHYHSTHVAGTIGGAGVANPAYKGMAPGVTLVSYGFEYDGTGIFLYSNPGDIESDYAQAINTYGAAIANNSIGTNTETNGFDCTIQGNYGVTSQLIDTIVRGDGSNPLFTEPFRIVWANGNERQGSRCDIEGYGDYYSTAPPAGAKNHIAVGALNSNNDSMTTFSSWGPTDDGRLKPDISAPGCQSDGDGGVTSCTSTSDTAYTTLCGTSMAAPTVCGLSSLLLQDFRAQFPGDPDPRNSTLKALLAHNAVDLGNSGPDYMYGYGSVRIAQTIDFMRAENFFEAAVDQGATHSVLVVVEPTDTELKVTLAWDDYPGTPNVDPALVNDLDLRVFDPSNARYYPWTLDQFNPGANATRNQENHVDNLEQVLVNNPDPGVWRVEIHGFAVPQGPQPFSLCASPLLVNCSSAGTVALDASVYPCTATAAVQVIDCDLNTDDGTIQTVTVSIDSTTEPTGETVLLTESGAATADFRGSILLDTVDAAGVLQVAHGDTVTTTYIDADDGQGGINVPVTSVAGVDCVVPLISNVQATDVASHTAVVQFDTDEPALGTVRYGLSCAALTESATQPGALTAHAIGLSGLTENTTYFYAVDAQDSAGNGGTDDNGGACFSFATLDIPDYFTELFASDNDLDNISLVFTPNGSVDFYGGCAQSIADLPTDPAGGTPLVFTPSSDDGYDTITLSGGDTVSLYGTSYSTFYPGTNGYITFNAGDTNYTESLAGHFDLPRISALFDDLNPGSGGTATWKQLADRAVVTWQNVPEFSATGSNTFQIEMYFDGTVVVSYLAASAADGLAGLSAGNGLPSDFEESDLSAMALCAPSCTNGLQDDGEDRIDCGGPCPPCDCLSDAECDDALFCDGVETCDAYGHCQPGTTVNCDDAVGCTIDSCNETTDACGNIPDDAACDDALFCTGVETCDPALDCQPGADPCPGLDCDEDNNVCVQPDCDYDGTCELGEDCIGCPDDCFSGSGAVCGNGICEIADGEDCLTCPADCNNKLGGKPNGRFCCGDGTAAYGVTCADSRCTDAGNICSSDPAVPSCCGDDVCEGTEDGFNCAVDCGAPPVCGDATCDPDEDQCNCPEDCGAPPLTETDCADGIDNDCDGLTDGADSDCACLAKAEACTLDDECCSGWCHKGACK